MRALVLLVVFLIGCAASPPADPTVAVDHVRVTVDGLESPAEVVVLEEELVLGRRAGDGPSLSIVHGAAPDTTLTLKIRSGGLPHTLQQRVPPDPGPLQVSLDLPAGQGPVPLVGEHAYSVVAGTTVQAAVVVTVDRPGPVRVTLGDAVAERTATVGGERFILSLPAPSSPATLVVEGAGERKTAGVTPTLVSRTAARTALALEDVVFPADELGRPEIARPAGRVTLPAEWWKALLAATETGYRARDPYAPWGVQGVALRNEGAAPLNVVVTARVLDASGAPADAFKPRGREQDGDTGEVAALLRVHPNRTGRARLPMFVNARALPEGSTTWQREISVTPLGSTEPLWVVTEPLQVKRGSTWISLGFLFGALGALAGLVLLALRLRPWMRTFRTRDLVTVAVFATLGFLVSGASAIVSGAIGAVLGPFSIFVTNLLDDVLTFALLATLVTLLPRPGTATLSVLVSWLMRGVAMGAIGPLDIFFVAARVFWLEALLWGVGITRKPDWVDGPAFARWLRLGTAFSLASVISSMTGLVAAMVLYRLFYAGWYVAAVLAGPGFLYVWIACALGTGFADSLRTVED